MGRAALASLSKAPAPGWGWDVAGAAAGPHAARVSPNMVRDATLNAQRGVLIRSMAYLLPRAEAPSRLLIDPDVRHLEGLDEVEVVPGIAPTSDVLGSGQNHVLADARSHRHVFPEHVLDLVDNGHTLVRLTGLA